MILRAVVTAHVVELLHALAPANGEQFEGSAGYHAPEAYGEPSFGYAEMLPEVTPCRHYDVEVAGRVEVVDFAPERPQHHSAKVHQQGRDNDEEESSQELAPHRSLRVHGSTPLSKFCFLYRSRSPARRTELVNHSLA